LLEVIHLKQQLSEIKGDIATADASEAVSVRHNIGDKISAKFEQDGLWYNARVVALAEDGYFVTYLGFGNTAQVDVSELRPYVRPDTSSWRVGTECVAIAPSVGRWHEARIVEVKPDIATVRFNGESELLEVELDAIRVPTPKESTSKQPESSLTGGHASPGAFDFGGVAIAGAEEAGARLPKALEPRADDSQEDAARKKRKLSMFKRQEKKEKEDRQVDERRTSWQAFSRKNKTVQKAKNSHDPNWDPTRDHGEMHARLSMDGRFGSRNERE